MPRGAGSAPMVGHGSVHPASRGVNRRLGSADLGYKPGMPGALPSLSPEQQARLDEELAKQKATQESIQDLATNSITAWMTKVSTPTILLVEGESHV